MGRVRVGRAMMRVGVEEGPASGEAHGDDEAAESPAMDNSRWAVLSPELQDNILARLPVVQLFRMRTVCKHFRALMQLPSFSRTWSAMAAPVAAPEHWLLMFHRQDAVLSTFMEAYDPCTRQWYNLPVQRPFILQECNAWMASAKGLVCIRSMKQAQTIVVWNPLTNMAQELPRMSIQGTMHMSLMVDSATKAFVVVAVRLTKGKRHCCYIIHQLKMTEVYDSMVGFWKLIHTSSIKWRLSCQSGSPVHCNGLFHAIAAYKTDRDRFCLISFDLEQGIWKEACKLPMPWTLFATRLWLFVVTPGRMFLAEKTCLEIIEGEEPWECGLPFHEIRLWEQVKDGDAAVVEWIQVAAVPQWMMLEIEERNWENFRCKAIGNLVCLMSIMALDGLMYDLTRDAWQ